MAETKNCCVVIPVYKKEMSDLEYLSLNQCIKILHQHPIVLAAPNSLNIEAYRNVSPLVPVIRFNDFYFQNIKGYNRLMLSKEFYNQFLDFKYILIYQLDAWIFKDELNYWCNKNYDYVGAPWVNHSWAEFAAGHSTIIRTVLYKLGYRKFNVVGNGGLSLRKVSTILFNLKLCKRSAEKFNGNEDYFFSFVINSYNPFFKIPSLQQALKFSFDINPAQCFELNNRKLPMGCHAWDKNNNFWYKFIPSL